MIRLSRILVPFAAVACLANASYAQDQSPPQVPATTAADNAGTAQSSYLAQVKPVYDIVILGDVLGTGLWAGLNRVVEREELVTVTGRIQDSSGLARSRLYNWQRATARLVESRKFDIAAIMLGVNDARDINTAEGRLEFGSQQWREHYGGQMRALIQVLKDKKIAIYWFGVPPMARPKYDAAMQIVAEVERQITAEMGVRYIDLQLLLREADGSFTDSGDDGTGEVVRLRSRDGVKFITRGNDRLAFELMKLVRADAAVASGAPPPASAVVTAPVVKLTREQLAALPAFGAERADGAAAKAVDPKTLPGPDFVQIAKVEAGSDAGAKAAANAFAKTRRSLEAGTHVHKLFVEGVWPEPANGRPDPFTAPLPEGD